MAITTTASMKRSTADAVGVDGSPRARMRSCSGWR
jgi:hypothetical protein